MIYLRKTQAVTGISPELYVSVARMGGLKGLFRGVSQNFRGWIRPPDGLGMSILCGSEVYLPLGLVEAA